MGKATRWIKGLLGMKDKENANNMNSGDKKEKKRWSFRKPLREFRLQAAPSDAAWLRSYMSETEKEQNKHAIAVAAATAAAAEKHAIAVAAATAAAAETAVAAAQAAVAVVRLTNLSGKISFDGHDSEKWAAVKIQTIFRSHLARKAFKALKGLVKLQALVRGFLVRKRAVATLHSMQALVRAQAAIRSDRAHRSFTRDHGFETTKVRHRKSNFYDESSKIVEIESYKPQSRSQRINNYTPDSWEDFNSNSNSQYSCNMSSLHCQYYASTMIPEFHHIQDFEWGFVGNDYKLSNTAQSTPRYSNSNRLNRPTGATKSVCGDSFFRSYTNYPSYMGSTQSSKAKLRSHSAPKQRPDLGAKKRLSLNEVVASRYSLSGLKMQKSCYEVQEAFDL